MNNRWISNLLSGLIGSIIGVFGSFLITYAFEFTSYKVDSYKYIESAYYQIESVRDIVNETEINKTNIPKYKLLIEGVDWNNVFLNIQNEKYENIYMEICRLDDIRDKAFQVTNEKEKGDLISLYWEDFEKLKYSNDLFELSQSLNNMRQSTEEKRINENSSQSEIK